MFRNRFARIQPSLSPTASRALQIELKSIQEDPIEGFTVSCDDNCLIKWTIGIFGPPGTPYQGGYFKATMKFPGNYPYSPPVLRFNDKFWHPNVYEHGEVCISILHPAVNDPHSGELLTERWNPTQCVRTILLSVISMIGEPNVSSPANVDASVMYRSWKESNGEDDRFVMIVKEQVEKSKEVAKKDGVKVPETIEEYVVKKEKKPADYCYDEDIYDYEYDSDYEEECEHDDDSGEDGDE